MEAKYGKIILDPGNSLLIPSGWIHAMYTPEDSVVIGGNFVVEKQLQVAQIDWGAYLGAHQVQVLN